MVLLGESLENMILLEESTIRFSFRSTSTKHSAAIHQLHQETVYVHTALEDELYGTRVLIDVAQVFIKYQKSSQ